MTSRRYYNSDYKFKDIHRRVPHADQYFDRQFNESLKFRTIHSFQPEEVSRFLPGKQDKLKRHSSVNFLSRVENWKKQHSRRLKKQIKDKEKKNMKECTFRPSIGKIDNSENSRNRSYHRSYQKAKRNFLKYKIQEEKKIRKECTFKPKILSFNNYVNISGNKNSETPRKIRKRANSTPIVRMNFVERISKPRNIKLKKRDPQCTFKPRINHNFFENKKLSNSAYLESNAFERLSKNRKRSKTPDVRRYRRKGFGDSPERVIVSNLKENNYVRNGTTSLSNGNFFLEKKKLFEETYPEGNVSLSKSEIIANKAREFEEYENINNNSSRKQSKKATKPVRSKSSGKAISSFLKRTEERDQQRVKKLEFLRKGIWEKYKPRINPKSKEYVKDQPSFLDRLDIKLARQRDNLVTKRQENFEKMKFKPYINPKSRRLCEKNNKLKNRDNRDRYLEHFSAKSKISYLRNQIESERMKEATFQPKLKKTRDYFNKVNLNKNGTEEYFSIYRKGRTGVTDPDIYMKQIERKESKKNWQIRKKRKEEIKLEMKECSFKPTIGKLPKFVKKISNSYQLSKIKKKEIKKRDDWK